MKNISANCLKSGKIVAFLGILVTATSCGKVKVEVPDVKFKFGDPVELSFELKNQDINFGIHLEIPDLEGAFVELVPNNSVTGSLAMLILSVPAAQFENEHFRLREPSLLPDGRPLPRISGKLPAVAIQVPRWNNITFYLGLEIAGIFIPTTGKFDPDVQITLPFSDNTGREVGFITRIPSIEGKNGGFFASFNWNLAVSNPNGFATIHERDLRHAFIKHPLAQKYGYSYNDRIDLSEIFELPR